jgi:hypothetical protein
MLSFGPVFGQDGVSEVLAQGLKQDPAQKATVPAEDQEALLAATASLLKKHVTFRADGTASTFYTRAVRRSVEWKKFVVTKITSQTVTEADKLNGVSKKYSVIFGCSAHREWDADINRWGEWLSYGYGEFPLGIVFHFKNDVWIAESPALLKYFAPGPGQSISDSKIKEATKGASLPPGMQKAK